MPDPTHGHPGQDEPRSYGETHHENRVVDLNAAPESELAELPMIGPDRAHRLVEARPFSNWDEVARVEGIGLSLIDDLKSGGAQLGGAA